MWAKLPREVSRRRVEVEVEATRGECRVATMEIKVVGPRMVGVRQ